MFQIEGGGLGPPGQMEFGVDVREVIFDCLVAQPEFGGDFFVGLPLGHERQESSLLRRQQMLPLFRFPVCNLAKIGERLARRSRIEEGLPLGQRAQGLE